MQNLLNRCITEQDDNERAGIAEQLVKFRLVDIVAALGPFFTGETAQRTAATRTLVLILNHTASIPPRDSELLLKFMISRLEDAAGISDALDGIEIMVVNHHVWDGVLDALSKLDYKHLLQAQRYKILQILESLRQFTPVTIFVRTFVDIAGGEKDPQNLLLLLEISRKILRNSGSKMSSEERTDIYDITFCYFPVTFNPPKDMPYNITAEEIRLYLRETLASPYIAEWVVPGLIEKLTAVNVNVKVDALLTLHQVLVNSDPAHYWKQVWDGVRFELLYGQPENETFAPGIKVLQSLVNVPDFQGAVESELKSLTTGDESKPITLQMSHIVVELSKSSPENLTWNRCFSAAIESALNAVPPSPALLNVFISALSPENNDLPHSDRILQVLLNSKEPEAVKGLTKLAILRQDYSSIIVHALCKQSATEALTTIAASNPDVIKEYCLPEYIANWPRGLSALGEICCTRSLVHDLVIRLLSRLESSPSNSLEVFECILAATENIRNDELYGFNRFIPKVLELFVNKPEPEPEIVVDRACILVEKWTRFVPLADQPEFARMAENFGSSGLPYALYVSCIIPLRDSPLQQLSLRDTVQTLEQVKTVFSRAPYLRLVSATVNKWPHVVKDLVKDCSLLLSAASDPASLEVLAWATKGLVLRADNYGFDIANQLTRLVPENALVARVYGVLISPDRVLVKENGIIVRHLFRQRIFNSSLKTLLESGNANSTLVLSSLIRFTPRQVVLHELHRILPLLMSSLETPTSAPARAQEVSLLTLKDALITHIKVLDKSLDHVVRILLRLVLEGRSVGVKTGALSLLIGLKQRSTNAANYGQLISKDLAPALGDPKREVRRLAAECRQVYY